MSYEIEKGVPLPPDSRVRYPFREMEVGDRFTVPAKDGETAPVVMRRVSAAARAAGKRLSRKFTTRIINDGRAIGVWREA